MENEHHFVYWFFKKILYILTCISPKLATRFIYFYHCHKILHLKNPQTFDEKINYLKLYINPQNPLVTTCADKVEVRSYLKEKNLADYLIPIIGIYDSPKEINWEKLPEKFVIKCNHGSGFNIICHNKDEMDEVEVKEKLSKWLKIDYGKYTSEIHYSKITRKIIIEEDISMNEEDLKDYKFFCFNGKVKYVEVISGREDDETYYDYYDIDFHKCNFTKKEYASDIVLDKPKSFDKMIEIAKILCNDFPFVRVDLYNVDGKIYFGELTFTPSGGCSKKLNRESSLTLGNLLTIKGENNDNKNKKI